MPYIKCLLKLDVHTTGPNSAGAKWGRWNRETWHHETWQRGIISQGWTSRDLFQCSSRCSLRVYVWCREYYISCSSVLCLLL